MLIQLSDAGKRFNRDWIFRHISYQFQSGDSYAIIGSNGSGKSTLLQVISGSMGTSEGKVSYSTNQQDIAPDAVFRQIGIVAPYLEVIEEMTATEFLTFHSGFKPFIPGISIAEIIDVIGLSSHANKQIRFYSSGMKQRIKIAQAVFSDCAILLLDEPCTNFDKTGFALYNTLIETYAKNKLVIVSSNDEQEYHFCKHRISIADYK